MTIFVKYYLEENCIKYNSFEEIENYNKVVYIDCLTNQLSELPKLPNSLQILQSSINQLTELPKLPNSLQRLSCEHNNLKLLPELPNSFFDIWWFNNQFIKKKYKYLQNIIY